MVELALIMVSLLGFSLLIRQRFKLATEETPILAVAAVILLLYMSALVNVLVAAIYALIAAGLGLLAWVLVENRKALGRLAMDVFTPGMVLFIVGIPAIYLLFNKGTLTHWDEFSRWGLAAKDMVLTGALPRGDTAMTFPAYLPGTALFQTFFCKLIGWREGLLKVAHLVIAWAAAIVFTRKLKWKHIPLVLLALAPVYVGYVHFNNTLHRIQVDGLLGLLTGAAFALYYRVDGRRPSDVLKTIPVLALLVLVKDSGSYLAALLCLLMAADSLFSRQAGAPNGGFLHRHGQWASIALAAAAIAAVRASWSVYMAVTKITANLNVIHPIYAVGFNPVPNPGIIPMFLQALYSMPVGIPTYKPYLNTAVVFLAVFFAACAVLMATDPDRAGRKRTAVLATALVVGMILYAAGIILLYLYMYSPYEAESLASYSRYFGTFLLAMFLCLTAMAMDRLRGLEVKSRGFRLLAGVPLVIFLAFSLLTPPGRFITFWRVYDEPTDGRVYSLPLKAELDKIAAPSDPVYLVFEGNTPMNFYTFKYDLYPRRTNVQAWNIGIPDGFKDTWMTPETADDWARQLAGYQYVYVGNANAVFQDQFGALFENGSIQDHTLYTVGQSPGGRVLLKPVG